MTLSYEQAVAAVTGPGQVFEIRDMELGGVEYKVFANAPGTLREVFANARAHAGRTFLVYEDERWSFAEVMARVDAFAAALVGRYGVGRGDRVAIGMRNYPEWVMAFAAVTSVGATAVSLNAWWTEDELAFALQDSRPTILVADVDRMQRTRLAAERLGVRTVVVRSAGSGELAPGVERWEDVAAGAAAMPEVGVAPGDDATILYTSGTTGRPKGAVSTNRAVTQALFAFFARTTVERARRAPGGAPERSGVSPADDVAEMTAQVFILVVPLFHVTGCVPVMLSCFALGMRLVMMHRWDPARALELIQRERVTSFVGVPTQSWDLLESPRFASTDTSSLRSIGGGGAPAPPRLVERVASSFASGSPTIGYGMTETNAYGPGNTGEDYLTHPTSTGRALPIVELAIRGPDGRDLPPGEPGEIWMKGPHLIRGYWGRPEETAAVMVDGWLRTGDLGRLDDDGFLYVEDRIKDMILRAGENVYGAEVEAALYEHPAVTEAAVFGVPHERLGEEVAAVVVTRSGTDVSAERLREFVGERLATYKVPTLLRVVDTPLPRNPAGKVLKRQLRSTFGD